MRSREKSRRLETKEEKEGEEQEEQQQQETEQEQEKREVDKNPYLKFSSASVRYFLPWRDLNAFQSSSSSTVVCPLD